MYKKKYDPRLKIDGIKECKEAAKYACEILPNLKIILVSPLKRAY